MVDHMRRVAVSGTGTMGAPIARNLLHAGFAVRVWNRTTAKATALAADGVVPACDPAEAATGADVLITMLTDGATVEDVMTGHDLRRRCTASREERQVLRGDPRDGIADYHRLRAVARRRRSRRGHSRICSPAGWPPSDTAPYRNSTVVQLKS
jgi:hypothetical protein